MQSEPASLVPHQAAAPALCNLLGRGLVDIEFVAQAADIAGIPGAAHKFSVVTRLYLYSIVPAVSP